MIIEVNEVELVELFGAGTKLSHCGGQYLLNGKVFLLEGYDYWTNFAPHIGESRFTYRLSLRIIKN